MRVCLLYNYAQHYRTGIFKMLDTHFDIDFYFGDKMGDVKKIDYGILTHKSKELHNIKILSDIYWQKGALRVIFKNYDRYLVLGEYYCLSTWIIVLLSKFYKQKKVYFWTHGWYGNESFIKKMVKKIFFKLADGVFLYGEYAKRLMVANGFNSQKLHVIYNSLDYEELLTKRKDLKDSLVYSEHFGNSSINLIFVGRLTKVKELHLLLYALAKLNEKEIHYNLTLVGDGEMKEELIELSGKLNIHEHIWFYGESYSEQELSELIYNAGLCVSPGNVGLTAIHAMSYGTPVVTHNNFSCQMPEFEAIVKGENGDFFEKGQINSLSETVENWFSNSNYDREAIRNKCYEVIDSKYNPIYQMNVIKNVLST